MKKKKFSSNGNEFRYNARGNSAKYYDDNDGGMDEDSHNEDSEEEERKKKKLFSTSAKMMARLNFTSNGKVLHIAIIPGIPRKI